MLLLFFGLSAIALGGSLIAEEAAPTDFCVIALACLVRPGLSCAESGL